MRAAGKIVGHVGDDAVLVVARGAKIFAVGAACTHYHGPLGDGLVVGDTIRCPWHHACFSLLTGEAVRAPAFDPVACWRVERRGQRIVIREKLTAGAARPRLRGAASPPSSVVIVGGGAAGFAAAEMLRRQGYDGPVVMVSADKDAPYDRPNVSKDFLAGTAPPDWMPLRDRAFYRTNEIELLLKTRVANLDTIRRVLTFDTGATLEYGALLLATGAAPVALDVPGADGRQVHYLRSLADARAIIAAVARRKRRVAVVGASFIGLEVAASLRARKIETHVIAPDRRPLEKVLGPHAGDFIRELHESHGVTFHLGDRVSAIARGRVMLERGGAIAADLVIVGIGVRPVTDVVERAGITVDDGVVVNEYLETSAPGVCAAGDIARWPDARSGERIRVEHWVVAERQGQTAARNILGARERFEAPPFFWSQHYDVSINYLGHASAWDRIDRSGSLAAHDCALTFRRDGRVLAVATVGRDLASLKSEVAMERALGKP